MRHIIIPLFILVTFLTSFIQTKKDPKSTIIYIQPLGYVDNRYITEVKTSIESFYKFKCVVNQEITLSKDILTISQTRYDANKILNKFKSDKNILIITEKDITTKKGSISEWGVLGLGYRPGSTCVVSTFRLKRNATEEKMLDRLKKVSIHEVGHNLGLDHCDNDANCLMNDARGTIKQVDREKVWMCQKCLNFLKK